jgi:hypothetical protein
MAVEDTLGLLAGLEERKSVAELKVDVATLAFGLGSLTADIGIKIAPEVDRLRATSEDHTGKLNEVAEELGRLNRNLEILQTGLRRVINKVVEQERKLDRFEKERIREKAANAPSAPKNPTPATTSGDDAFGDFDGLFKDMGNIFKDMGSLFKFTSVKKTTKG